MLTIGLTFSKTVVACPSSNTNLQQEKKHWVAQLHEKTKSA